MCVFNWCEQIYFLGWQRGDNGVTTAKNNPTQQKGEKKSYNASQEKKHNEQVPQNVVQSEFLTEKTFSITCSLQTLTIILKITSLTKLLIVVSPCVSRCSFLLTWNNVYWSTHFWFNLQDCKDGNNIWESKTQGASKGRWQNVTTSFFFLRGV